MTTAPWRLPVQPVKVVEIPCISDVVKHLLELQLKHGDLPVFRVDWEYGDDPIELPIKVATDNKDSLNSFSGEWANGPWPRLEIK